jgi:hypothetical protein
VEVLEEGIYVSSGRQLALKVGEELGETLAVQDII